MILPNLSARQRDFSLILSAHDMYLALSLSLSKYIYRLPGDTNRTQATRAECAVASITDEPMFDPT